MPDQRFVTVVCKVCDTRIDEDASDQARESICPICHSVIIVPAADKNAPKGPIFKTDPNLEGYAILSQDDPESDARARKAQDVILVVCPVCRCRLHSPPKKEAYLRVEPLIGEQAQVDWAHVGQVPVAGGQRALWLFVQVLSWSRAMWGEFVLDLGAHSLARSLVRAAGYFGGTPRQWLFDNPKSVVLERHAEAVRFHPVLLEVAGSGSLVVAAPDVPPELPLSRWLYLRNGQLTYDGPPAPQVETQTDEALA